MLKFIFMDFMEPTEVRVFSGAHCSPPGGVPTSASLPSPMFQEHMVSPCFLCSVFSALAPTCYRVLAPYSCGDSWQGTGHAQEASEITETTWPKALNPQVLSP